jgi:prevent-host-death family protein
VKRLSTAEARKRLASLMEGCARNGDRVKITRYGSTAAYLISKADLERLEDCDDADAQPAAGRARPPRR